MRHIDNAPTLPTGGQLFLFLTRRLSQGELHDESVQQEIYNRFDEIGFPEGAAILHGTLAAVLSCAMRTPEFGASTEGPIVPDEQRLLDCLASLQQRPEHCACRYVEGLFEGYALAIVMPYLIGMARLFAARGLLFADLGTPAPMVSGCLH